MLRHNSWKLVFFVSLYMFVFSIYFSIRQWPVAFITQYMTNSTLVSLVKMEYGWNFSISGLKMMMKSGLRKFFLKFLHALTMSFLLLNFDQKYRNAKISPIFHFDRGHQSWIFHILCVNQLFWSWNGWNYVLHS